MKLPRVIITPDTIGLLESSISESKLTSLAVISDGISPFHNSVVVLGIAVEDCAFIIPVRSDRLAGVPLPALSRILGPVQFVVFDGRVDSRFLCRAIPGFRLRVQSDVQADYFLLDPNRARSPNREALSFAGMARTLTDLYSPGADFEKCCAHYSVSHSDALEMGPGRAEVILAMHRALHAQVSSAGLRELSDLEAKLAPIVGRIEDTGIYPDLEHITSVDVGGRIAELKDRIREESNFDGPLDTATHLRSLLEWMELKDCGDASSGDFLEKYEDTHPAVTHIREMLDLVRLRRSLLTNASNAVAEDGRLHAGFISTGTVTGRFSSDGGIAAGGAPGNLDLYRLPTRASPNIRKILSVPTGSYWLHADFSQIDYRVLVYMSGDLGLIADYESGADFHVKTAAMVYGADESEITDEMRYVGKTLNLAVVYGMTSIRVARLLGMNMPQVDALLRSYWDKFKPVAELVSNLGASIRNTGFSTTAFGLKRYVNLSGNKHEVSSAVRSAINHVIQGTSATIAKKALVSLSDGLAAEKVTGIKMVLPLHDEINMEVDGSISLQDAVAVARKYVHINSGMFPGWGPFPIRFSQGPSYGELTPAESAGRASISPRLNAVVSDVCPGDPAAPLSSATGDSNSFLHEREVEIKPPSVVVELGRSINASQANQIKGILDRSSGRYTLYFKIGGNLMKSTSHTVNPSEKTKTELIRAGAVVRVVAPSGNEFFDPSTLVWS